MLIKCKLSPNQVRNWMVLSLFFFLLLFFTFLHLINILGGSISVNTHPLGNPTIALGEGTLFNVSLFGIHSIPRESTIQFR